jgi:hypothetical protein
MTIVYKLFHRLLAGLIGLSGLLFLFLFLIVLGNQIIFWIYTSHWISLPASYLFFDFWSSINSTLPDGFNIRSGHSLDVIYAGTPRDKNGIMFMKLWIEPLYFFSVLKESIGLNVIGEWLQQKPDMVLEGIGDVIWVLKKYFLRFVEFIPLSISFACSSIVIMISWVLVFLIPDTFPLDEK